jgi:hypothetical protein
MRREAGKTVQRVTTAHHGKLREHEKGSRTANSFVCGESLSMYHRILLAFDSWQLPGALGAWP